MSNVNEVWHGDCLELMKNIPDNSIDMILCDLPYGTTACKWDTVIPFESLWKEYERIISSGGCIALFGSQPFTTLLINSNIKNFKYAWYWEKNQSTNFLWAHKMPLRKIEEVCIFYSKNYNPQKTYGNIPTNSAKGESKGVVYYGENKRDYIGGSTERFPNNLLEFKCVNNYNRLHPSQKPVELFEYLIKTYTNEGDLVLDNCAGSGTTAIAALNTGRNYLLIEKEKEYFDIINRRIEEHNPLEKFVDNQ